MFHNNANTVVVNLIFGSLLLNCSCNCTIKSFIHNTNNAQNIIAHIFKSNGYAIFRTLTIEQGSNRSTMEGQLFGRKHCCCCFYVHSLRAHAQRQALEGTQRARSRKISAVGGAIGYYGDHLWSHLIRLQECFRFLSLYLQNLSSFGLGIVQALVMFAKR